MNLFALRSILLVWALLGMVAPAAAQDLQSYLPLAEHSRWILRNAKSREPVVFEVLRKDGDGYYMRSTNPWGSSEWVLVPNDDTFVMTKFGANGQTMQLPDHPVFLDFSKPAGGRWTTKSIGNLEIVSRSVTIRGLNATYNDCVQVRHSPKGGNQLYTFAKGVGFVQFGVGDNAFVLDEAASNTATSGRAERAAGAGVSSSRPATRSATGTATSFGVTPNRMANEPNSPDVLVKRFQQTVDLGVNFLVGNAKWTDLEPTPGRYNMGDLRYLVSAAKSHDLPLSYTLHLIDTIHKNVPDDLKAASWNSSQMKDRVVKLIDQLVPAFQGQVRWFMFGYEADGYFTQNQSEIKDFVALYEVAAARLKQLAPGLAVSTTFTYSDIGKLRGPLAALNEKLDFLALTYIPMEPGWKMKDPSVLPADFARMKEIAAGRKIVLQEIAYATAPQARGSVDKQAEFYRLAFQELRRDPDRPFEAVNFMILADLSDKDAEGVASGYGLGRDATFKSVLQTLGMFDGSGRAKKSWDVIQQNIGIGPR